MPTQYRLQSVHTNALFADEGFTLDAPGEQHPTLIRAVYQRDQLAVTGRCDGIFCYADWLPVHRHIEGSSAPVTFRSEELARRLGLNNLWITFSGWWPEKGAMMKTCSFKETEAYPVCARRPLADNRVLVVASAGNTARAFARVCSDNNIPLLLCVPHDNLDALWSDQPLADCVKLLATRSGSDYFDAIHLSNIVAALDGFVAEGGARNVARRDGMGTTVLSAVTTIGAIPRYYFQAVGSGTGAIAAWEANMRLVADGRFGNHLMKLMVSQNDPFLPMYDAWHQNSRELLPFNHDEARQQVEAIDAKVLSNRKPPYSIVGGLFDALTATGGTLLKATNEEGRAAMKLFAETEGCDIHPAAGIALASLISSVNAGHIAPDDLVMLNITGGGEARFKAENQLHYLKPHHVFDINPDAGEVRQVVEDLFRNR